MSFIKKIFNIKKTELCYIITIFGINLKFMSNRQIYKNIIKIYYQLNPNIDSGNARFIWENKNILTFKQKKLFLERLMYKELGYFPNLKNPKTFNEKLNWMKLYYNNPFQKICVDKYEFKNYIKEKLGDGYTIPLIGVYNDVNDIDFNILSDKFVIKSTLEGGGTGVYIIKKQKIDKLDELKYKLSDLLQEWHTGYYSKLLNSYENLTPRIIIEEYIEGIEGKDYKFHCFHGEPKIILAVTERTLGGRYDYEFLDMNYNRINFHRGKKSHLKKSKKPKNLDKMIELSKILAKDFPFVRVDFYEVGDTVYIGELTFTPAGGLGKFEPVDWDYKMGEWLDLNKLEKEYIVKEE